LSSFRATSQIVAKTDVIEMAPKTLTKSKPHLIGYARVSKGDNQSTAPQLKALRAAGCRRIFEENGSGGRWDRPELQRMLDHLHEGDIVVVWKLDRLSRSLKDLLVILEKIDASGAGFRPLTESIDTTTPAGRIMMQMLGSFAEFERQLIRQRTKVGLDAARSGGCVGGRPRALGDAQRREIVMGVRSGRLTQAEAARLFKVSTATICRLVAGAT
jgi:DNA invertase Pin-like site-specific DNA recombinase